VLFNFHEATDLNFVAADVEGSILAPWAQVDSYGGVVFGTAVAGSWSGPMSFVHMPFSGSLPEE
jgi:choice-of-anchor A domain-containing protein